MDLGVYAVLSKFLRVAGLPAAQLLSAPVRCMISCEWISLLNAVLLD